MRILMRLLNMMLSTPPVLSNISGGQRGNLPVSAPEKQNRAEGARFGVVRW
ncbi:hypothetical protein K3X41_01235 [Aliiroseovarius crassostreae]|uniref:hypothetical protein n=1 Tax=Aliiroseovarius crassostreae TaxID=154981 RepID=UPI00220FFE27|nr:hypothetical protein [Aliiroseovarius crassostreae]UWQ08255.1 hypothetical protein K3X25_01235 [Aliiroseovarius crassostreae]UWQ11356.1 hypothetical protein K3X41_01235 [Aliiroseovarius crassostreae]